MKCSNDGLILTTLDLGNVAVTEAQIAAARVVITSNALDTADKLLLLSALGIGDAA